MSVDIDLDETTRLTSDHLQWILSVGKAKKDRETGELVMSWVPAAYCSTLEKVMDSYIGMCQRRSSAKSLRELEKITAEARECLSDLLPRRDL